MQEDLFRTRLKLARKRMGLSQEALGETLGVSAQSVKEWEAGRRQPQLDRLPALALALGQPLSWFFEDSAYPEPSAGLEPSAVHEGTAPKVPPDVVARLDQIEQYLHDLQSTLHQIRALLRDLQ